jgi:DNA-binding NarL/FixJ family response regulator
LNRPYPIPADPTDDGTAEASRTYLTPRELEVARLLVDGLSNQAIADRLSVSRRTVHAHLSNAMGKTGTQTRTQLAVFALRAGLVPLTITEPANADRVM